MRTTVPTRIEDVKDPVGRTGWPKDKGRDGERTPMQWTPERPNAGFTAPNVKPWLPIPPTSVIYNVETESKNPNSILNFYKQLLVLRRTEPALVSGGYTTINPDDPNVFSFLRHYLGRGRSVLVVLNMSNKPQTVTYNLSAQGVQGGVGLMLLSSYENEQKEVRLDRMTIPPFGTAVMGVQ
jgi:alpha-glucosidase